MKTFSLLHLILGFCGGLLIGFVAGGIAGRSAAEDYIRTQQSSEQPTTELSDTTTQTTSKPLATTDTKKGEPKKAEPVKTQPAKSEPKKTEAKAEPAKTTPTAPKTAPKPTATTKPANEAPKTIPDQPAGAPKGTPAFSLVDEAKSNFYFDFATFASSIEDIRVSVENLKPWGGTSRDYAGTYMGGVEGEITKARVVPLATGRLNLVFTYTVEEFGSDGLVSEKSGDETAKSVAVTNSAGSWKKTGRVYATRGQFVRWEQDGKKMTGLLVHGEHPSRPYLLLRKTGK